jgi:hypothetical protein
MSWMPIKTVKIDHSDASVTQQGDAKFPCILIVQIKLSIAAKVNANRMCGIG